MSDFLPIGMQDFMHRWQSGLPKVDRKDSPLSQSFGKGLDFFRSKYFILKVKDDEYI
jgi:hypothetical protein